MTYWNRQSIPINRCVFAQTVADLRVIQQERVETLKNSIRENNQIGNGDLGLLEPILVRPKNNSENSRMTDFEVIDGGDRVLAFRSLYGEGCKITADVGYEITPDQALLIHIDKNISRRERDVLERGELMLLRRQILARTNQLAQAGNNRFTMQQAGDTVKTRAMLAKEANLSPRSTQLYERIAAKLTPETKQAVRDAGWENNTRMLTRIAGIEPEIEGSEDDNPIENSERVLKEVSKAQIAEIRRIKAEDEDKAAQKADEQAQRTARQEARQASKPSPIQGSRRNLVAVP